MTNLNQLLIEADEFGESLSELDKAIYDLRRQPMLDRYLEEDIEELFESGEELVIDDDDYLSELRIEEAIFKKNLEDLYNNLN